MVEGMSQRQLVAIGLLVDSLEDSDWSLDSTNLEGVVVLIPHDQIVDPTSILVSASGSCTALYENGHMVDVTPETLADPSEALTVETDAVKP